MEKVFLKPTSQEIVIKGNIGDGHTDVFAYDYYGDESKRKLGGLFIVGNVKGGETEEKNENAPDIAYVVNLIASLAKREYYSRSDILPKDAFSSTLKKINGVVEEFFRNKSLKVNIGIFAISGDQILISKLGKFKIMLGRDARVIDILNNVDLFTKEQVQEKEFSNIISGKIVTGDKLFAFYPNRLVIAREKTIKANLLSLTNDKFIENINSIKETRPDFDCGAIYMSINNHKEKAVIKKPKISIPESEEPIANLAATDLNNKKQNLKEDKITPASIELQKKASEQPNIEIPRIISSEFSLGKKANPFFAPIKILKSVYKGSGVYLGSLASQRLAKNINMRRKIATLSLILGVIIIGIFVVKKFVVVNPEQRQINKAVSQAQSDLKIAKTKIEQNDFIGARQILFNSLASINSVDISNEKTKKVTANIYEVLDNIDKAVEISPSLLEKIPDELNQEVSILNSQKEGIAFDLYENNLYVLLPDKVLKITDVGQDTNKEGDPWLKTGTLPPESSVIAVDGNVYVMSKSGVLATFYKGEKVSEINTFIVSGNGDVLLTLKDSDKLYLVNKLSGRIYELDKKSGSLVQTLKVGNSEPFVNAYLTSDEKIIVTTKNNQIWQIK